MAQCKYYEEIKKICKKNNIKLIVIMTPMCENVVGMNYFQKVEKAYPEIYNYENIQDLIEQLKVVGNSSEKYQELVNSIKLLQKKFPTFDLQLKKLFLEME